jgi:hypothetical protein
MVATTNTAVLSTVTATSKTAAVAMKPTRRRFRENSEKREPLPKIARSRPIILHERDDIPTPSSGHFLRGSTSIHTSTAHTNNRHTPIPVSDGDWRMQTPLPLHAQTRGSAPYDYNTHAHAHAHTTTLPRLSTASNPTSTITNSNATNSDGIYVAHSCLLIPVVVAAWWFWTKRAAKRVLRKLTMLPQEPCGPSSYSMNMGAGMAAANCNGGVPGVSPTVHNHSEEGNQNHFNYSNYSSTNQHDSFDSNIADTTATATSSAAAQYQQSHQQHQVHQMASFERDANDDDQFYTWEDVLENETSDPSVRFVRWIKGKNYKAKRRMEAVSRFSLRRRNQQYQHSLNNASPSAAGSGVGSGLGRDGGPEGDGLDKKTPILQGASNGLLQGASSGSTAESVSIKPAKQRSAWQCIQDTGAEICAIETKDSNCNSVVLSTNDILELASPTSTRNNRGEGIGAFFA